MKNSLIKIVLAATALLVPATIVFGQTNIPESLKTSGAQISLPKGLSAWSYSYDENIAAQISSFNSHAKLTLQFKYFFPYAGSLDFDLKKRDAALYYNPAETSDCYAKSLPGGTLIMPIIDARADNKEFHGWTDEQYQAVSLKVAKVILEDRYAAGVQIDIEPFTEAHLPFYKYLRKELNAKGKYIALFAGPKNDRLMAAIFESCDLVILSGYDLDGENTGSNKYKQLLKSSVARVHKVAQKTNGRYMVGIPAAASWGEYEYTVDANGHDRIETGVRQEDYVQAALSVMQDYNGSPEFLGVALWQMSSMQDTTKPDKVTKRTKLPNSIRPSVWTLLEKYAF